VRPCCVSENCLVCGSSLLWALKMAILPMGTDTRRYRTLMESMNMFYTYEKYSYPNFSPSGAPPPAVVAGGVTRQSPWAWWWRRPILDAMKPRRLAHAPDFSGDDTGCGGGQGCAWLPALCGLWRRPTRCELCSDELRSSSASRPLDGNQCYSWVGHAS
jgi:hypothetical protein